MKTNLLPRLKVICISNPFDMKFILNSNFATSCLIRRSSKFFRLLSEMKFLQFRLTLTMNLSIQQLNFFSDVTIISYFNIVSNKVLSQIQQFVELKRISLSSVVITSYLLFLLDTTKLKIVWIKTTTFFKRRVSSTLGYFSS